MSNAATAPAVHAAEISLLVFCASIACFLPPLSTRVLNQVVIVIVLGLAAAASLILHLIFVGAVARSYGRSPGRYAALALLTLPLGSIVGLVLIEWQQKAAAQASGAQGQA